MEIQISDSSDEGEYEKYSFKFDPEPTPEKGLHHAPNGEFISDLD